MLGSSKSLDFVWRIACRFRVLLAADAVERGATGGRELYGSDRFFSAGRGLCIASRADVA
jgi:hypothetical protein